MAKLTTSFLVFFALIFALVSNMGEMVEGRQIGGVSPNPSSVPVKKGICVDGYGVCSKTNDDYECKYRCYKAWESFNPQGVCEDSPFPGVGRLCNCYHDCEAKKLTDLKLF